MYSACSRWIFANVQASCVTSRRICRFRDCVVVATKGKETEAFVLPIVVNDFVREYVFLMFADFNALRLYEQHLSVLTFHQVQ